MLTMLTMWITLIREINYKTDKIRAVLKETKTIQTSEGKGNGKENTQVCGQNRFKPGRFEKEWRKASNALGCDLLKQVD